MAKSYLNQAGLPRGIRNNNPGNLRLTAIPWDGKVPAANNTDGSFEQFIELRYGIRAMMRDLVNDIKGGKNTLSKLITSYSPAHENNTAAYINTVAAAVGLAPLAIIDLSQETIIALCKIMVRVENGEAASKYIADGDYRDAMAILGIELKKKVLS